MVMLCIIKCDTEHQHVRIISRFMYVHQWISDFFNSPLNWAFSILPHVTFLCVSISMCVFCSIIYLTRWNELGIVCYRLEPFLVTFNSACQTDKPLGRRKSRCGDFLKLSRRFWPGCSNSHHAAWESFNNSPVSLIRCVETLSKLYSSSVRSF